MIGSQDDSVAIEADGNLPQVLKTSVVATTNPAMYARIWSGMLARELVRSVRQILGSVEIPATPDAIALVAPAGQFGLLEVCGTAPEESGPAAGDLWASQNGNPALRRKAGNTGATTFVASHKCGDHRRQKGGQS